jgi:hypothetical protein
MHRSLTFLGWTLGMSSEYLSTRYDSADDGHMAATKTATSETKHPEYATDGMTLMCDSGVDVRA